MNTSMNKIDFYIGSYAKPGEESIIKYSLDMKDFTYDKLCSVVEIQEPSYICLNKDKTKLYSVMELFEFNGEVGGAVVSYDLSENKIIKTVSVNSEGTLPCHIWFDEKRNYVYTSNYWNGSISMFKVNEKKDAVECRAMRQHSGTGPNKERQEGPHVHFSGPSQDGTGIWVVDLGMDCVKFYEINEGKLISNQKKDIYLSPGIGPRHFVMSKIHEEIMYVVCELGSEIDVVDTAKGEILQRISTLPSCEIESACAAIRMSENGRYVYASNRGHDSIAVFEVLADGKLGCIQIIGTDGKNPRDFNLSDGFLLVANQDSNCISIFQYEEENGRITSTGKIISCVKPSCIAF